jgi:hypothetical protein
MAMSKAPQSQGWWHTEECWLSDRPSCLQSCAKANAKARAESEAIKHKLEAAERELKEWRTGKRQIHYPATVYAYNGNDLTHYAVKVCAKCGVIAPCPIHPRDR